MKTKIADNPVKGLLLFLTALATAIGWASNLGLAHGAPVGPASVDLISFTAQASDSTVTLTWETGTETDNAGFNLYRDRAAGGAFDTRINDALIAAQGSPESGAVYTFEDTPGYGTFYYMLESVDTGGQTMRYGPADVTVGHQVYLPLVTLGP